MTTCPTPGIHPTTILLTRMNNIGCIVYLHVESETDATSTNDTTTLNRTITYRQHIMCARTRHIVDMKIALRPGVRVQTTEKYMAAAPQVTTFLTSTDTAFAERNNICVHIIVLLFDYIYVQMHAPI